MSVRLYVGNLPKESVERQSLQDVFVDLAESTTIKIIKDRKTNKCRGFAFVTVPTDELADQFIEKYNGLAFMEGNLKIEKALPRVKSKDKEEGDESISQQVDTDEVENTDKSEETAVKALSTSNPPVIGERKKSNKKQRTPRGQQKYGEGSRSFSSDDGGIQPDPRWASELAKLKDMLSTQTANT